MRIGIDVDGVLADFVGAWLKAANSYVEFLTAFQHHAPEPRLYPEFTHEDVTAWDFSTVGDKNVRDRAWQEAAMGGFARTFDVLPGAVEAVDALRAAGHELWFVTAQLRSNPTWAYDRVWWLKKHFGVDPHRVVFTGEKYMVDVDVLLDDRLENVEDFVNRRSWTRGLLLDRPWNRDREPNDSLAQGSSARRVPTLAAAVDYIKEAASR